MGFYDSFDQQEKKSPNTFCLLCSYTQVLAHHTCHHMIAAPWCLCMSRTCPALILIQDKVSADNSAFNVQQATWQAAPDEDEWRCLCLISSDPSGNEHPKPIPLPVHTSHCSITPRGACGNPSFPKSRGTQPSFCRVGVIDPCISSSHSSSPWPCCFLKTILPFEFSSHPCQSCPWI